MVKSGTLDSDGEASESEEGEESEREMADEVSGDHPSKKEEKKMPQGTAEKRTSRRGPSSERTGKGSCLHRAKGWVRPQMGPGWHSSATRQWGKVG